MDFQQSLDYLYGLNRFGIKLGLENMQALMRCLPELQPDSPCVHVAGTNGKGSVSALLSEILKHSGLRVGLYTSPHLHCFTERIRIDGQPVSRDDVARLVTFLRQVGEGIPLTFFEMTTALALLAFRQLNVDVAVVETGLGGRLDATNVLSPRLSLVTPVSFDHQQHLGSSLVQIAAEKAGIIKPHTPLIAGRQQPEVAALLERVARQQQAPMWIAGRDYHWSGTQQNLTVVAGQQVFSGLELALCGEHQLDNYAQAVAAACHLKEEGLPIRAAAVANAGKTTRWPGRLEWWGEPRMLLDAAHNAAGAACLADYLRQRQIDGVRLVFALTGERRAEEVLEPLRGLVRALFVVPVPEVSCVSPQQIADWAQSRGMPAQAFPSIGAGLSAALDDSGAPAPVVVSGSIYLVAAVRGLVPDTPNRPGLPWPGTR